MSRTPPFHCPYCGEEDLRPSDAESGAWECRACARVFRVTFIGLLNRSREEKR